MACNQSILKKGWHYCKTPFLIFLLGFYLQNVTANKYFFSSIKGNKSQFEIKNSHKDNSIEYSFKNILKNNLIIVIICLLGWILGAIPPVIIIGLNGYHFSEVIYRIDLINNLKLLLIIIPHTIFEFLGFFLATGVSIDVVKKIYLFRNNDASWIKTEYFSWISLAALSITLIIISAVIEYFLTFKLIKVL
jgi:uncharacterized membrane protein SpoIIM required for sporulation